MSGKLVLIDESGRSRKRQHSPSAAATISSVWTIPPRSFRHDQNTLAKRIKISDPDLTIVVGSNRTYTYLSREMAEHSCYIRTKLVQSLLKTGRELEPMTLYFPDISPSDWEQMIQFVDPECMARMSVMDAIRLRKLYEAYGFEKGTYLCDAAIYGRNSGYR